MNPSIEEILSEEEIPLDRELTDQEIEDEFYRILDESNGILIY